MNAARIYNQSHVARAYTAGKLRLSIYFLDVELPMGSITRSGRHGKPLLDNDRGAHCGLGWRDRPQQECGAVSSGASQAR